MRRVPRVLLTLSSSQHPHVVAARQTFWQRRFSLIRAIFDKAASRGEFPRRADATALVETLIAPLYFRALITGRPLEDWPSNDMLDRILATYGVGADRRKGNPKARRSDASSSGTWLIRETAPIT
jgi:hypothetical protein